MSESRSAWARSCSTWPAAITAIIAWLAKTRRACSRDGEGSSRSAGSSAQMRPTISPGLVVERDDEPVVVPGVRAAPVHGRGEGGALRRARDGRRLRDEEAALDLEGGVQQRADVVDRDAPLRRVRDVVPAGDRARRQQPRLGVDELDHDLLEVQRAGDAVAHLLEHLVDRAALGQARGDLQQLLERGAVARGLDRLLRALQSAGGERHHGHQQVELVVGGAHAGDRLADRDDAEQVPVGVPAGHEELVAGDPGVGARRRVGWSGT